jgi:cytochrome P450
MSATNVPDAAAMTSLREVADVDPFAYYDRIREQGPVVWDEGINAWVATTYDATKSVMRQDEGIFRHIYSVMRDPAFLAVEGGLRVFTMLEDEDHSRMHRWLLRQFTPREVDERRSDLIRPVVDALIDRIDGSTTDLFESVAQPLPVRVIASLMGLPWQDDAWIARCVQYMDIKFKYLEAIYRGGADEIAEETIAAMAAFKDMIRPFVPEDFSEAEDNLITRIARDGHLMLEDWSHADTLAMATNLMFVGSDTTMNSLASAFHVLAQDPALAESIRGDRRAIMGFSEEILRLYGAVHFRPRIAMQDTEVEGVAISKGERVINLHLAANRDPARYECPHDIDLRRKNARDHMAFGSGPRVCVGAALARAEMEEAIDAVLSRLDGLRADPSGRPAAYHGFQLRHFRPVDVTFDRVLPSTAGTAFPMELSEA